MSYHCHRLSKRRSTINRSPTAPVHHLDDDSLLIIFSFCRPIILDESEANGLQILEGGEWNRERWWHRIIQVCRRWRYLALESAFHLRLSLVCGRGTPVADMLAHSPPAVPLIIDHFDENYRDLTAEDEEGIIFALQHRDRVRRIRLLKHIPILQKLITALDGEFPILEFLLIEHQRRHRPVVEKIPNLNLPETFRAPNLRQLVLKNFTISIQSPLLTTMRNLVTLLLHKIPSCAYFHPNTLHQWLSLMPQLEILSISFNCYKPNRDVERQLLRTPIMTRVTLPNLHRLGFRGSSAYLEALLPWITIPLLAELRVHFFYRMIYSIPHLRHFMVNARNIRLKTARFNFLKDLLRVTAYPHVGARMETLQINLGGRHLNWQVVSAAQVFNTLRTVFSTVEHLILSYDRHNVSSEWNNKADRTRWREFLGSFDNVKTLRVEYGLVKQVNRALQPDEGESPTEPLPELQELSNGGSSRASTLFVEARQKAGRPVTLVRF